MWLALRLNEEAEVSVLGRNKKLKISGMADGCVGCLLAFHTKEQAAAHAGEGGSVMQFEFAEEEI